MMRSYCLAVFAVLLLVATARMAGAQSLADIARNQETRREQAPASRTYTNADLNAGSATNAAPLTTASEPVTAAPSSAPAEPSKPATNVKEDPATGRVNIDTGKPEQKLDESYWRRIARDLRGRLARAESDVAAGESELAASRPGDVDEERDAIAALLTRRRKDVRLLTDELTRFLNRARTSNVPSDWVR